MFSPLFKETASAKSAAAEDDGRGLRGPSAPRTRREPGLPRLPTAPAVTYAAPLPSTPLPSAPLPLRGRGRRWPGPRPEGRADSPRAGGRPGGTTTFPPTGSGTPFTLD